MTFLFKGYSIQIDDDLWEWIKGLHLGLMKRNQYVAIRSQGKTVYLHRAIVRCPKGKVVDHINGNPFDNRRINLRICSNANNIRHRVKLNKNNKNGKCGVYHLGDRWIATIKHNRKRIDLGKFRLLEDAIDARRKAEQKLWGKFKGNV